MSAPRRAQPRPAKRPLPAAPAPRASRHQSHGASNAIRADPRPAPHDGANTRAARDRPPRARSPGTFVVQLGSFGSRENAERLVRDMTAKGFATFIAPITTNGRELYRVRVGPTRDRASAEALAAELKRVGQSGSIVPIS